MSYDAFLAYMRETGTAGSVAGLLGWDQQTYMPPGGAEIRARQIAYVSGLVHRRATAPEYRDLLEQAEAEVAGRDADSVEATNVRDARREYDRAVKVPAELVEELARASTLAHSSWIEARESNDFKRFQPALETIFGLVRRTAEALGYEEHPYDALLDGYEPGATASRLQTIFTPMRDALVALLERIQGSDHTVDDAVLHGNFPVDAQETLVRGAASAIGFDFRRGRLDTTAHPFCGGCGPDDVRLTTRYNESFFSEAHFGLLHEAGHGMYEQGLSMDHFGTPMGAHCSLGVHESQSRLWENFVGRSLGYWRYAFPLAQKAFPDALGGATLDQFHRAVNSVAPSLIRVEADEVTYNLHIFLRMEIEIALLGGDLEIADLPAAWNDTFERYLGFRPPSDADGCLQDVHWGAGLIGYFPTYALGNVYSAQLFDAAQRDLGELEAQFSRGEFAPLRDWLHVKIHSQGRRYTAADLVERATGQTVSHEPLIRHLETKYSAIYGL